MKLLTIGMACYDDYDGVFFTIQSLRMHHAICNSEQVEFMVVDNNPEGRHAPYLKNLMNEIGGRYILYNRESTSWTKYEVAKHASGKYVLILDCHVLLMPGAIDALLKHYKNNPDCKDLVQGPIIYDNLKTIYTHLDPIWRGHMLGIWACNRELLDLDEPFPIQMQGMGLLSFERANWPGIHSKFKGFGAEEGYVAERFRQAGGQNICLPKLQWLHRFNRPNGVSFRLTLEDRIFNYFLGALHLYGEDHPFICNIHEYFRPEVAPAKIDIIYQEAKKAL